MVSGQVEIKQYPFMEDIDEFFLVASDGLWDVMTSQEVVDFVHDHLNDAVAAETQGVVPCSKEERSKRALMRRRNMARYVANESISRGSMDNVSVLIVWLREI
jgi:serine/threonine protein phosphatase PrpC